MVSLGLLGAREGRAPAWWGLVEGDSGGMAVALEVIGGMGDFCRVSTPICATITHRVGSSITLSIISILTGGAATARRLEHHDRDTQTSTNLFARCCGG